MSAHDIFENANDLNAPKNMNKLNKLNACLEVANQIKNSLQEISEKK